MNCKTSSLCLLDEQDVQTDITGKKQVDFYPVTSLSPGAPIEFLIPGTNTEYLDLKNTDLHVIVQIVKKDGSVIDSTKDKVCLVNNPIASLFQDVFLTIGNTQVEGGQHCYPYNAYLSSVAAFHPSAKRTHMQAWGWNEDYPGKFDAATNSGIKFRSKETENSKEWELIGPLFLDMFRQDRCLLPRTDVRIRLLPSKPEFALQVYDAGSPDDYIFKITKCVLSVRRLDVIDSVIAGHIKGMDRYNANYHVRHTDTTTFTIAKGHSNYIKDRLYVSRMPRALIVGLLEHDAFNRNIRKSPFNFHHFNLNKIGLYADGELVPGQILQPNFKTGQILEAYVNTMKALDYFRTDDSNGLTIEHFKEGYTLYAFDLTPDGNINSSYRNINKGGSLRLEVNFDTPLADTITVMLFAAFDAKVEITKFRDVIVNYNR